MTDIIKGMNPTAPLATEDAALSAARASAVGMIIGAAYQAISGWYASTPEAAAAAARVVENLTGQAPDQAQMAHQAQMGLIMTGVLVLIQLLLAVVQWRKPNGILPIIFLVLVIWGLGTTCIALFAPAMAGSQPMWLIAVSLVALLIMAVAHISGIRGASALKKLRDAGPLQEEEFL